MPTIQEETRSKTGRSERRVRRAQLGVTDLSRRPASGSREEMATYSLVQARYWQGVDRSQWAAWMAAADTLASGADTDRMPGDAT